MKPVSSQFPDGNEVYCKRNVGSVGSKPRSCSSLTGMRSIVSDGKLSPEGRKALALQFPDGNEVYCKLKEYSRCSPLYRLQFPDGNEVYCKYRSCPNF